MMRMPSPLHYFPFHHRDWLSSMAVRAMSLESKGAFIELLCYQWEEGSIPDSPKMLARILGISLKKFTPIWSELSNKFPAGKEIIEVDPLPMGIGQLKNPKLEELRILAQEKCANNARAGSKGGRPPKKTKSERFTNDNRSPKRSESEVKAIPESEYISTIVDKTPLTPQGDSGVCSLELEPPTVKTPKPRKSIARDSIFVPPTLVDAIDHGATIGLDEMESKRFWFYWDERDWIRSNKKPIEKWKSSMQTWKLSPYRSQPDTASNNRSSNGNDRHRAPKRDVVIQALVNQGQGRSSYE